MKKNTQPIERISPSPNEGLTSVQVKERVAAKLTNKTKKVVGKSYLQIFVSNIFTFFNFLGLSIFLLMVLCGSVSNTMGIVIVIANTAIGIFQEIRSKRAVEKLSIVNEPTATVVRDGKEQTVATCDIVLDDILLFSAGKQICSDCVVVSGEAEVNESMLTGESDPVLKNVGDSLLGGSFVVSGNCAARCEKVGKDCYVEQLSSRVKKAKMPDSQLMKGIRLIIKCISVVVVPLGLATFLCSSQMKTCYGLNADIWNLYWTNSASTFDFNGAAVTIRQLINQAIIPACSSMLGMIPSGMVLLTSVALAVAALKLALKKVLVRELPCIEMLARVDTLCLDKTGTITDGSMTVSEVVTYVDMNEETIGKIVKGIVEATGDDNMTAQALKKYLTDVEAPTASASIPFSSARKFSAATFDGIGTIAIGAAEFLFPKPDKKFDELCEKYLRQGLRVLAVGIQKGAFDENNPKNFSPVALIVLQDTVRSDAPEIIGWFAENNVDVKVISGDNPLSVSVIAQKVGVKNAEKYISLEGMTDEEVEAVADGYTVFGRVSPEQKAVLVRAMKAAGRTVAMTGDGVNDILAMRESDCAISVGCGTDAAKTVANLVLTDNKFSQMPRVVAEGRQVVNNIQNSTSLFLMKTVMMVFTTILCLALQTDFTFEIKQLYTFEFFIDGIPSFFLALKPNRSLIKGKFLSNTLKRTLPSGLAMFLSVAMCYAFHGVLNIELGSSELSTVAMFSMTATGVIALLILLWPYDKINIAIGLFGSVGSVLSFVVLPKVFELMHSVFGGEEPTPMYVSIGSDAILFIALNAVAMGVLIVLIGYAVRQFDKRRQVNVA